jgi:MFS family permease
VLLFLLITCIGEGIMGALFAPFVHSILRGSGAEYGVILSAQAIGGIAGGVLAASLGNRVGTARTLGCAAVAFGALDLVLFLYPLAWTAVWPAILLTAAVELPGAFLIAAALTLIQRHTSDRHRGRVFGALNAVEGVALVAGTLTAGFLAQSLGVVAVLATQGAGYVVAGGFVLAVLRDPARPSPARSKSFDPRANHEWRSRCGLIHRARRAAVRPNANTTAPEAKGSTTTSTSIPSRPCTYSTPTCRPYVPTNVTIRRGLNRAQPDRLRQGDGLCRALAPTS